jgi:hypothetical protein
MRAEEEEGGPMRLFHARIFRPDAGIFGGHIREIEREKAFTRYPRCYSWKRVNDNE